MKDYPSEETVPQDLPLEVFPPSKKENEEDSLEDKESWDQDQFLQELKNSVKIFDKNYKKFSKAELIILQQEEHFFMHMLLYNLARKIVDLSNRSHCCLTSVITREILAYKCQKLCEFYSVFEEFIRVKGQYRVHNLYEELKEDKKLDIFCYRLGKPRKSGFSLFGKNTLTGTRRIINQIERYVSRSIFC